MNKHFLILPPPNLTGQLHTGHILNFSIYYFIKNYEQIINNIQYKIIMGFDHSALYAEIVAKKQIDKLDENNILSQISHNEAKYKELMIKTMAKFDFQYEPKTLFTFDEVAKNIVQKTIKRLKGENKIFKSTRIYMYDEYSGTFLSNVECEKTEIERTLYTLKYKILNTNEYIQISTTTLWNIEDDRMIAVSPKSKFHKYVGRTAINPITNEHMSIISDKNAKEDFGTGAFKITPCFSKKDNAIYTQYFEKIKENPWFKNKTFTTKSVFKDMTIQNAKTMSEKLLEKNIVSKKQYKSTMLINPRTKKEVYQILGHEYILNIDEIYKQNIQEYNKTRMHGYYLELNKFINNLEHWYITRQNYYGHTFDKNNKLDTWFSSALMPIIMQETYKIENVKEINIKIITGYDILFFWIFKMICMSTDHNKYNNIADVYSHGLICDQNKNKISKSKGNTINIDVQNKEEAEEMKCWLLSHRLFTKYIILDESKRKLPQKLKSKIKNIISLMKKIKNKDSETHQENDLYTCVILQQQIKMFSGGIVESINNIYEHINFINNIVSNQYIEYIKNKHNGYYLIKNTMMTTLKFIYMYMPNFAEISYKEITQSHIHMPVNHNISNKYSSREAHITYYFIKNQLKNIYLSIDDKTLELHINKLHKSEIQNQGEILISKNMTITYDYTQQKTKEYKQLIKIING